MNENLRKAKDLLFSGRHTCVLIKGDAVYNSNERGVAPLLAFLESGNDFHGFSAADKVVGKAAAFVYVMLGIKELYAAVISEPSVELLKKHKIAVFYDEKVPFIRNRSNTGFCPMEQAVKYTESPEDAIEKLKSKIIN